MATLLQVNQISKSYGGHVIFEKASLNISEREKIAVIGRNGAGKSTLFRIIVGLEDADSGDVNVNSNTRLGYLTQHNPYELDETVIDFLIRSSGKKDWECAKIAGSFQIKGRMLNEEIGSFAGGYQTRIKLVSMLLEDPNLLLLDEPTNYLDLSTQLLLEKFLKSYNGAFLLISHDREFIKKTCNKTTEIDQGKITMFPQPLEEYLAYKEEQITMKKKFNVKVEREKKHLQKFVDRFAAKASKASQAQSKMKQIKKLKTIEILHPLSASKIRIPRVENKTGIALNLDELIIGYPEKTVARGISLDIERGEHIAVLGDNGQGKSTLLKTIAGELSSLDGKMRWGANIKIGYYAQHVPAMLNSSETIKGYLERVSSPELSDQEIFEMAGNFLFRDEALKKEVTVLSGGEKARLCLAALLLEKNNVLLMDEPTNHLDFETVEALASALKETNSTVIFVSHNRTFVDILANGIVEVKDGTVRRYHHNYEDYVYHLEARMEEQPTKKKGQKGQGKKVQKEATDSNQRTRIKKAKKQLKKIEGEMAKVAEEKTELLNWFEGNYSKFSKEKNEKLSILTKMHDDLELKWMDLQLEVDAS